MYRIFDSQNVVRPQINYEHVFTNYIDHKPGSNEYRYEFPEHWMSYNGKKRIGLRSITVKNAARDLRLRNIYFKNSKLLINIGASISLSSNDDMSAANEKFKEAIKNKYIEYKDEIENVRLSEPNTPCELGINDYTYEYVHSTNEFQIKVLKNDPADPCYLYFTDADSYMSDDLKSVLGIDDTLFKKIALMQKKEIVLSEFDNYLSTLPNVNVVYSIDADINVKIQSISFKNVWNRETLFITSTLSTLSEEKFLTLSNVKHYPLKWYDINGFTTTFSIFTYEASRKNSVELPNDRLDLILVEMLMCAD